MHKTVFQLHSFGQPLRQEQVPLPVLTGSQVLIRVLASGLCHSDLHLCQGAFKLPTPLVLGHEIAGEVIGRGPLAKELSVGDKVIVWGWLSNDIDTAYGADIGVGIDGGFSSHVVVPEERFCVRFHKIPTSQASLLACSGLTAYSALKATAPKLSEKNRFLVILGAGGLGLQAVRLSKLVTGVSPIVCDISEEKLQMAKEIGPPGTQTFNFTSNTFQSDIVRCTGGGPDCVIDFVGSDDTCRTGMELLQKKVHRGAPGKYVAIGLYGGAFNQPLSKFIYHRLEVQGVYTGSLKQMKELVRLVEEHEGDGALTQLPVVRKHLTLQEVNATLKELERGRILGRAVFEAKL